MRDPIAIVQPASDIAKLTHRWELACGAEERAGKSLAQSSDWTVLRDFLQLAMLWNLCPTAEEII